LPSHRNVEMQYLIRTLVVCLVATARIPGDDMRD
jgi:hypothetical protein